MRWVVLIGLAIATWSGCRFPIGHSINQCETFIASLDCGDFDFRTIYPEDFCEPFEAKDCDYSEYLTCLADGAECDSEANTYTPPLCLPPPCLFEG